MKSALAATQKVTAFGQKLRNPNSRVQVLVPHCPKKKPKRCRGVRGYRRGLFATEVGASAPLNDSEDDGSGITDEYGDAPASYNDPYALFDDDGLAYGVRDISAKSPVAGDDDRIVWTLVWGVMCCITFLMVACFAALPIVQIILRRMPADVVALRPANVLPPRAAVAAPEPPAGVV